MTEIVDRFREKLSLELKSALMRRQNEDVSTIRGVMAALDNASSISQAELAKLTDPSASEVSRRKLSRQDIIEILNAETALRVDALNEYVRIGNKEQIDLIQKSLEMIRKMVEQLDDVSTGRD